MKFATRQASRSKRWPSALAECLCSVATAPEDPAAFLREHRGWIGAAEDQKMPQQKKNWCRLDTLFSFYNILPHFREREVGGRIEPTQPFRRREHEHCNVTTTPNRILHLEGALYSPDKPLHRHHHGIVQEGQDVVVRHASSLHRHVERVRAIISSRAWT